MKKFLFIFIAVVSLLVCACSGKSTKAVTPSQDSTVVADTTVVDTMAIDSID